MKKLFIGIGFVWVLILIIGTMASVSALDFDNVKNIQPISIDKISFDGRQVTDYVKEYPKIEIDNAFGLPLIGDKIMEGYLSQHDNTCGIECKSTIELKTYGDSPLVQDIYFETILEDGSRIKQDVRSYQFYIKTNQRAYQVDDYEYQCTGTGKINPINGTEEQTCENVKVGTHTEYEPEWEKYNIGEVLTKGVYTLKLEAEKKPSRTVDWVIKTNGEWLEEWATWGSIGGGDDAEVILNSPADDSIIYVNNVQFNATATVTGGATLTNMSLWTNESGSFELKNSTSLGGSETETNPGTQISAGTDSSNCVNLWADDSVNYGSNSDGYCGRDFGETKHINWIYLNGITVYTSGDIKVDVYNGSWNEIYTSHTPQNPSRGDYNLTVNGSYSQARVRWSSGQGGNLDYMEINTGTPNQKSSTQTWNRTITDPIIWNVQACDSDGDCGFATSNYSLGIDTTAPTIDITGPETPVNVHVIGNNLYLNTTINDTNLDSCWFEYNNANTTIDGCVSGVLNSTAFATVEGEQSLTVYANDSVGNINSSSTSWTYNFVESAASYEAYAYETQSDTFELNFTTQITVQSISAELNYGGSTYTSTANCVGNDCTLTNTIDLPLVSSGSSVNNTFFWEFTIFDGASSNSYNSTSRQQNVSTIDFVHCGGGSTALNFSAAREDTLEAIDPFEFDGSFDYWIGSGTIKKAYSYSESGALSVDLCIAPGTETFYIDGTIEYDNASGIYVPRNYLFDNYTINNATQQISLLLLEAEDSTTFIQEVLENNFGVEDAIIYTYRYYAGSNSWNITQITQTDENGKTVGFYEAETATYKHLITVDGTTRINETNGRKMIPESVPYTITWDLDVAVDTPWEIWDDEFGLSKSLSWNEDTNLVTYTYTGNSSFSNGNLTVYQEKYATDDLLVCNSSSTLSSASMACNLTSYEGNFIARAYIDRSGETLLVDSIRFDNDTGKDIFGTGGVILGWFIILVAGCAFLIHPIIGIVALNLAIILVNLIGLVSFGWLYVFGILAVSGVLIWLMKD